VTHNYGRAAGIVGMAIGALLAPPLISLLASPVATADGTDADPDLKTITLGPDDTLTYNVHSYAFDNFSDTSKFDVDVYSGGLGSDTHEILLTDPNTFQIGVDDIGGKLSFIDIFNPADLGSVDPGSVALDGVASDLSALLVS